MPAPPVDPTPSPEEESFRAAPELAQEASYLAASARIWSLLSVLIRTGCSNEFYCSSEFFVKDGEISQMAVDRWWNEGIFRRWKFLWFIRISCF